MRNLMMAISSYIMIGYINLFTAMNIINPYNHKYNIEGLVDIGFHYIPKIDRNIPNVILLTLYIFFFIKWFAKNKIILVKFYILITILFIFRLIAFTITILPPNTKDCVGRRDTSDIIWFTILFDSACSDYMFSGHAVHITMITLFTIKYSNNFVEKIIIKSIYVPYLFIIIAARLHYSTDVFIGTLLSILLFYLDIDNKILHYFRIIS